MSDPRPEPVSDADEFTVLRSRLRSMRRFGPGDFPILSEAADALDALIERAESAERDLANIRHTLDLMGLPPNPKRAAEARAVDARLSAADRDRFAAVAEQWRIALAEVQDDDALTHLLAEAEERGRASMQAEAIEAAGMYRTMDRSVWPHLERVEAAIRALPATPPTPDPKP